MDIDVINYNSASASAAVDRDVDAIPEELIMSANQTSQMELSKRSAQSYLDGQSRFLKFLYSHAKTKLNPTFREFIRERTPRGDPKGTPMKRGEMKSIYKLWVSGNNNQLTPENFPLHSSFESKHMKYFLEYLQIPAENPNDFDAKRLSPAHVMQHRSAIVYMFRQYNVQPPRDWAEVLRQFTRGSKRRRAEQYQFANTPLDLGKAAIRMPFYITITSRMIELATVNPTRSRGGVSSNLSCADWVMSHTYCCLQWNLMSRTKSIASICFEHLRWVDDSLQIYFCQTKTDQEGTKAAYPRHIYANPIKPEICPITALGYWLMCGGWRDAKSRLAVDETLFGGLNKKDKFSNIFLNLLRHDEKVANFMTNNGISQSKQSSHSFRKVRCKYIIIKRS